MKRSRLSSMKPIKVVSVFVCTLLLLLHMTAIGFAVMEDQSDVKSPTSKQQAIDVSNSSKPSAHVGSKADQAKGMQTAANQMTGADNKSAAVPSTERFASYPHHSVGGNFGSKFCIHSKSVNFSRQELDRIQNQEQLEEAITEKGNVTVSSAVYHQFKGYVNRVQIDSSSYQQIIDQKYETNTWRKSQQIKITKAEYPIDTSSRTMDITVTVSGQSVEKPVEKGEYIDYPHHSIGGYNDSQYCIHSKAIVFTRQELGQITSKEQMESVLAEKGKVTISTANTHRFVAYVDRVLIDDDTYESITGQKHIEGIWSKEIRIRVTPDQYSELERERMMDVRLDITGDPIETTTESSSSDESKTTSSNTTKKPTTSPTTDTQTINTTEPSSPDEEPVTSPDDPEEPGQPSENYVQTNPSSYDTVDATKETDKSLEDEILTADITAAIVSPQPAGSDNQGGLFKGANAVALSAGGLAAVGFALSIGSDVSCIRRITQIRNLKK